MIGNISVSVEKEGGLITVSDISKILETVRNSLLENIGLGGDSKCQCTTINFGELN